jgi:hypothetical protein
MKEGVMHRGDQNASLHFIATIARAVWSEIPGGSAALAIFDGIQQYRANRIDHVAQVALAIAGEERMAEFIESDPENIEFVMDVIEGAARARRENKRIALGRVLGGNAVGNLDSAEAGALAAAIDRLDEVQIQGLRAIVALTATGDPITTHTAEDAVGNYAFWSLNALGVMAHREGYAVDLVAGLSPFGRVLVQYLQDP